MQYAIGTVNVTNGNAVVVGVGTLWSTGPQGPLPAGSLFSVSASGVPYFTAAVPSDDTHVTLTAAYGGPTLTNLAYSITTSFEPAFGLPYMNAGDVDTATIFKAAMVKIGQRWGGYTSTATAAGTTTLYAYSTRDQEFTGSTTQTILLPVTSTLTKGRDFQIINASSGLLTVNSSGGNFVCFVSPGVTTIITCRDITHTDATDWTVSATNAGQMLGNAANKAIFWNADTITEAITIASGQHGLSAGSPSIGVGGSVTINAGGDWTIVS